MQTLRNDLGQKVAEWNNDQPSYEWNYSQQLQKRSMKNSVTWKTLIGFLFGIAFLVFMCSSVPGTKKWSPSPKASKKQIEYINRFKDVAVEEHHKFGIPVSITLAQGVLESGSGQSKLAKNNNNHFGIKCFSRLCKKGHCTNFKDDSHKDFFRKYASAWESFREHSKFLKKPNYKSLYNSNKAEDWAIGLQKAGYATNKNYAADLLNIINFLDLKHFDYEPN
jgi:flagellum-specific peptidoglycan hydrolase FlgJ